MRIASVSQPIGDIIRLRKTTSGGTGWYIDGVAWLGAIRTVGVGKDFTTLVAAVADANAAAEDCLYIIDPGTYSMPTSPTHKAYMRGLGEAADDTIIDGHNIVGINVSAGNTLFIENLWIFAGSDGWDGATIYTGNTGCVAIANKAIIGNAQDLYGYFGYGQQWPIFSSTTDVINTIYMSYTKIIPTYRHTSNPSDHMRRQNRATVSLIKVSFTLNNYNPGWNDPTDINSFAVDDKAIDGTAGYGPDYGNYRITRDILSVSQKIGETMNLRKTTGTMSVSQPIRDTINLRRNV